MTTLSIRRFSGAYPVVPSYALPDNAAQTAKDCDVRQGELRPMPLALPVFTNLPAGIKGAFSKDGLTFLTSASPMSAALSPTIDDVNARLYFTNDEGFRVCKWTDCYSDGRAVPSWRVGVPRPSAPLTVERRRKNRWPGIPNTVAKLRFFFESGGQRYGEVEITPTAKPSTPAFSGYTFDSTIDVATALANAAAASVAVPGKTIAASHVYFVASYTHPADGRVYPMGWNTVEPWLGRSSVSITETGVTVDALVPRSFPALYVTRVRLSDGTEVNIDYTGAAAESDALPTSASPAVEFWIENTDDGSRVFTAYSSNSSFSYGANTTVPGGVTVSLTPTGPTTYELNLSYGFVETRSYVYTMINDWGEESAPSDPVLIDIGHLDDVVLRVDFNEAVEQLQGYRPFDHLQFYCAAENITYLAVRASTSNVESIEDLFRSLLWRDPKPEGLAYYQAQYNAGRSMAEIAAEIMQSEEYKHPNQWLAVEDLYWKLLNRAPIDAELTYWTNELERGVSMPTVIWGFVNSAEFKALHPSGLTVTQYFQKFLGRNPLADGLAYWNAKIAENPYNVAHMIDIMLASTEYLELNRDRYITDLLTEVYKRAPTPLELEAAITQFENGASLNHIAYVAASSLVDTGAAHIDEGNDRLLGWTLGSTTWTAPPPDLKQLTVLPNGVFAAFKDRTIYFSEPYRAFAWPDIYAQTLAHQVVAMRSFEGQLLVATHNDPVMVSGAHPEGMTQQRITANSAAVSPYAISEVSGRPVYASRDGLVMLEGTRASLDFSHQFWSSELWRSKYGDRLSTMRLVSHDDRLIGLFDSGDGFIIHYDAQTPNIVEFSEAGGFPFSLPGDTAIYLAKPMGVFALFGATQGAARLLTWHSKEFTLPANTSFAMCKLVATGSLTLTFYGDGEIYYTTTVSSVALANHYLRLPSVQRYLRFSVKIEGTGVVQSFDVAHSAAELRNGI